MLDKRTKMMLEVANTLTAEDLEYLKTASPIVPNVPQVEATVPASPPAEAPKVNAEGRHNSGISRGQRERQRTRASKVSTGCVGNERAKHEWWPIGAELVGRLGNEVFTATVVENPRIKSGRSILITSGPAQGSVCITPTRAALEATEAYRQANNLGRAGGVTNGWTFWHAKSDG